MIASSIVILGTMVIFGTSSTVPILAGIAVSAVTLLAVSLLTAPTPAEQTSAWEEKISTENDF